MAEDPCLNSTNYIITYRLRKADLRALQWALIRSYAANFLFRFLLSIALSFLIFIAVGATIALLDRGLAGLARFSDPRFWAEARALLAPALVFIALMFVAGLETQLHRNNAHLIDTVVTFDFRDSGVSSSVNHVRAASDWAVFVRVVKQRNSIVLLMGPRFGVIVPRRAFASPEGFDAFAEYARQKVVQ